MRYIFFMIKKFSGGVITFFSVMFLWFLFSVYRSLEHSLIVGFIILILLLFIPFLSFYLYLMLWNYPASVTAPKIDLKSFVSQQTETKILRNGLETYSAIFSELKKATMFIHIEYYMLRNDEVGRELQQILLEKAKSGVEVRVLYDVEGSWRLYDTDYIEILRLAGVQVSPFPHPSFGVINFRNHRKIIVIDGIVSFTGGLNIGVEYLGKSKQLGFWRDTHLFVRGEGSRKLQQIFEQDWFEATNEVCALEGKEEEVSSDGIVEIISGLPKSGTISDLFLKMMESAEKKIWIATPYFIPNNQMLNALYDATLRGVDVRLLVSRLPHQRVVFYASRSYFPHLFKMGVKIYEYDKGFMHSKVMIIDDTQASIGTANMDMRSFYLNFEVTAFLSQTKSVVDLLTDYEEDLTHSTIMDEEEFKKRPLVTKARELLATLYSPLL